MTSGACGKGKKETTRGQKEREREKTHSFSLFFSLFFFLSHLVVKEFELADGGKDLGHAHQHVGRHLPEHGQGGGGVAAAGVAGDHVPRGDSLEAAFFHDGGRGHRGHTHAQAPPNAAEQGEAAAGAV